MEPLAIHLILPDGDPDGIIFAEIQDWSGRVAIFPRATLDRLEEFGGFAEPGIYVLLGENPNNSGEEHIYIGESESLAQRLRQHLKDEKKGFWKKAVILYSRSGSLNKAHIKSIESALISEAEHVKAAHVTNTNKYISKPYLAVYDQINVDRYLSRFKVVLKSLGINFLSMKRTMGLSGIEYGETDILDYSNPIFEIETVGAKAYGRMVGQSFVIAKGSTFRVLGEDQYGLYARQMVARGLLENIEGNLHSLTRDVAFASHSLAASMVAGKQRSGWTSWKIKGTRVTFKEWESKMQEVFGMEFEYEQEGAKFYSIGSELS